MSSGELVPAVLQFPLASAIEAARYLGFSRTSFWRYVRAKKVPAPYYLGNRQPRWRLNELEAFVSASPRTAPSKTDFGSCAKHGIAAPLKRSLKDAE